MSEIIQVALKMSDKALIGLLSGTMERHGGVIREAKSGAIVEHLIEVALPTVEEITPNILDKAKSAVAELFATRGKAVAVVLAGVGAKKFMIIGAIGLGVAVITGGVYTYLKFRSKKKKIMAQEAMEKCVADYNDSMREYLERIQVGNVNLDSIGCTIEKIDALRENKEIAISFDPDLSEALVNHIFDYTDKFAEANSHELIDFRKLGPTSSDETLIYLRRCLEIQKGIFMKAA